MSTSEGSAARGVLITVLVIFITAVAFVPPANGQFGRFGAGRGGMKTVNYDYKGQKYQIRLLNDQPFYVMQGRKILLMISNGTVMPYPGVDLRTAADAQDALKAYQAQTQPAPASTPAPAAAANAGLTVDGVVGMLQAGISNDIVIEKVRKSGQSFNLSTDDMIKLKKAGANDALLKAMMEGGQEATQVAPQALGTSPQTASPRAQPVSASSPQTPSPGHGTLQPSELGQMNNGTVRFDLNAIRLKPSLLENKFVMQYFIGLNNCQDRKVEHALQNELDYPALAKYYKDNATAILSSLPDAGGLGMFTGNHQGGVLWGRPFGGYDPKLKTLALGEYDTKRQVFPILVSGKGRPFEVSGVQHFVSDRQSLEKTCPVAYDEIIRSYQARQSLPSAYNVTFPAKTFNELPLPEAEARAYINSVTSSTNRAVYLGVDVHLTELAPSSSAGEVNFSGNIARIFVLNTSSGAIVGKLFDDDSLAAPVIRKRPTALTTMKTPDDVRLELVTAVNASLISDYCGWPLDPRQKANLRRFIDDINTYGNFNQRSNLNSQIGYIRNVMSSRPGFCRVPAERAAFERDAATLWPKGPMAAPAQ
jgi:hypothetical protein